MCPVRESARRQQKSLWLLAFLGAVLPLASCTTNTPSQGSSADSRDAAPAASSAGAPRGPGIDIHPDVDGESGVGRQDQILYTVWKWGVEGLSKRHDLPVPETSPVIVGSADYRIPVLRVNYPDLVLFGFDRAEPLGDMDRVMRVVAEILHRDAAVRVALVGHTDSVGSDRYNLNLSARRARNVLERLVETGVDPARVETIAAGEAMPLASNATEAGRAKNRRVEILLSRLSQANRIALREFDVATRWLNDHPAPSRQENDFPAATVETTEFRVFGADTNDRGEVEIQERNTIAMNAESARLVERNIGIARSGRPLPEMGPKTRPLTVPRDWDPAIYGGGT